MEKRKVDVFIGNEIITCISEESDEYILKLSKYVTNKIKEIEFSKSGSLLNPNTKMILIALNIADDYFKEKIKNEDISRELNFIKEKIKNGSTNVNPKKK